MVLTVFKTKFAKQKPKLIHYRSYTNFNSQSFKDDLKKYSHLCTSYGQFEKIFMDILEIHAQLKQKYLRANEVPYMSKSLKKAIMRRSQLESKFYRTKDENDKRIYKKQNNYVSRLYKRERAKFFSKLDLKSFMDNNKFWKTVKPFFSDKGSFGQKITLVDGKDIVSDENQIAEHFKTFV